MAEETGAEKSLPASGLKKQRAREQGNIAKSQDLNAAFALAVALGAMLALGGYMLHGIVQAGAYYIGNAHELGADFVPIQVIAIKAASDLAWTVLPFMIIMLIAGLSANLFQIGFLITAKPLQPRFDRLNPITGLKRFFSLRSLVELMKSLAKLTLITTIVYLSMRARMPEVLALLGAPPLTSILVVSSLVVAVWWRIVLAMVVIGFADYAYQRWQHDRDLRMTPQEAKQEAKELEGDPLVKRRIRQMMRQLATRRMMAEVPGADVVITNPTHYAVALRYDPEAMSAPVVVAKGERIIAERIRQIAAEHAVPIVQRPELARTLFRTIEINQSIPEELFRAVAEVLSFVYQIDQRIEKQRARERSFNPRVAV